jgi:hypothetical protein
MKTEFIQKKGLNLRKFTLTPNSILIESKSQASSNRYEVGLEYLGTKLHYQAESKRPYRIAVIVFGCMYLMLIGFYFAGRIKGNELFGASAPFAILLGMLLLRPFKDDIFLTGGQSNLVFFRTKPSENEVLEFIDLIKETRKNYLKHRYTEFDNMTSAEEFYARLNWLRSQEIITYEEYQDYKNSFDLLKLIN